jgi:predicted ester cyclase
MGTTGDVSEDAKAVVRRHNDEVLGGGDFGVFDELFSDDFVDHTHNPQLGGTPDKAGARLRHQAVREAFPDFHAEIHWLSADGDLVTAFKTYHGTHRGELFGVAPTGKQVHFEVMDALRVRDGKITDHWSVADIASLLQQIGALPPAA